MKKTQENRRMIWGACLLIIAPAGIALAGTDPGTPDLPAKAGAYHLTYANEFNDNSTATDLAGWSYDLGNGSTSPAGAGWGNNELESYTNSAANVSVSTSNGIGALHIDAIKSGSGGSATYTSARIKSTGVFDPTYGVIEFRAELPAGTGLWPAVWMLPENSTYGGWPTSGETDILESKGSQTSLVQGSLHTGQNSGSTDNQTGIYSAPAGFTTTAWHTYDLVWSNGSPGTFQWYVDGSLYETQTGGWYSPTSNKEAPFNEPFYLLINLAVGGTYGGTPSLTAGKSYDMAIDDIQYYQSGYVLGDTNNDGIVNNTDLTTLTTNFGKSVTGGFTSGDFNGDGVVNADDLGLFELGVTEQGGSGDVTPEPGMIAMLGMPLIGLRRRGGRGRRQQ